MALLEQLEVFGIRGKAAAEKAAKKRKREELARQMAELGESQPVDDDTPPADDE